MMASVKLLFLSSVFALANANSTLPLYNPNKCGLPLQFAIEITGPVFRNEPKNDDLVDEAFYNFTLPDNITETNLDMYHEGRYMKAELQGNQVILKPTSDFLRFEYETVSDNATVELRLRMNFVCGDENTEFIFAQPIKDVNNHPPTFNRKEYRYHFGMSITAGADLSKIMEIYAADIDYTNWMVDFSIEENDFVEITYDRRDYRDTKKIHYAHLITKRDLQKDTTYIYNITATDVGAPEKTGSALVKIIID